MTSMTRPFLSVRLPPAPARHPGFSVPARHNPRLQAVIERIDADDELRELWRCANVNASERLGLGDHGETHARIVANAGLRLFRLLLDADLRSGVVEGHGLSRADAEVVVVLAAALHDIGLSIQVYDPAMPTLALAHGKATQLLDGLYPLRERTAILVETLQAIQGHHCGVSPLTLESAVLTLADVLDLSKGRLGAADRALNVVESVHIVRGEQLPVRVEVHLGLLCSLSAVIDRLNERVAPLALAEKFEFVAFRANTPPEAFVLNP